MMYTKLFPLFAVLVTAKLALATGCMDTWGPKRCEKMTGKGYCVPVNECPSSKTFRCSKTRKFCAASCETCPSSGGSVASCEAEIATIAEHEATIAASETTIENCYIDYMDLDQEYNDEKSLQESWSTEIMAELEETLGELVEEKNTNDELNATIASMQVTIDELQGTITNYGTINSGLDLSDVDLSCGAVEGQDGAIFSSVNNRNLAGLNLDGAQLTNAKFDGVNLVGASLKGIMGGWGFTSFYQADLSGADLTGAELTGAIFYQANLTGAILVNVDLGCFQTHMANCANLNEAIFVGANLTGANFVGADVTGADFTNAIGANLTGATGV